MVEVTDNFLKGLKTAINKLKMWLVEVNSGGTCKFNKYSATEAWAEHREEEEEWELAQTTTFNGLNSRAIPTVVQDHGGT
jgi:hypothetical protein